MNRTFLHYLQEILATLVEDNRDTLPPHVFELLVQNVQKFAQVRQGLERAWGSSCG